MAEEHTVRDVDEALALLQEAVDIRGEDFNYRAFYGNVGLAASPACKYVVDDQPACLIGFAMYIDGATVNELRAVENLPARTIVSNLGKGEWTPRAVDAFTRAQVIQDTGGTWGEALEAARRGKVGT